MRLSLLAVALLGVVAARALSSEEEAFTSFVAKYQKSYDGVNQLFNRFKIFKANLAFINDFNTRNETYTLGVNEFADLTHQEFVERYAGLRATPLSAKIDVEHTDETVLRDSLDWYKAGYVAPVKNQGQCGSCWAFSALGALEGAWAIKYNLAGKVVRLSEQQLVDCSASFGNHGCNGGLMDNAFRYVIQNGICAEEDYPYTGVGGVCKANQCRPAAKISTYRNVARNNEAALQNAVSMGPVSVAVQASGTMQFYRSGIITSGCGTALDHGVLAVGYGTDNNVDFWNVKNSWGTSWGENGFVRIVRNKNMCGIALDASYPVAA